MPTVSVDTFFACSLMVLLVLTAMATTSHVLHPFIDNPAGENNSIRAREVSRYLLLTAGYPVDWGHDSQTVPSSLGFALAGDTMPYDLDVDKVSRMNGVNRYSLDYAQMFSALGMPDVSFRIKIEPCFDVAIEQEGTCAFAGETVYEFGIMTGKNGLIVASRLAWYVVAREYLGSGTAVAAEGRTSFNVTVQNAIEGPCLLVVFARSCYDDRIVSFGVHSFVHGSASPEPNGTFLRLSPLGDTLDAYFVAENLNISSAYALTFSHNFSLECLDRSDRSILYGIPHLVYSGPIVLVATGSYSSAFFADWTAYPQVPVMAGADFVRAVGMAEFSCFEYLVSIRGRLYECTVWVGGSRE